MAATDTNQRQARKRAACFGAVVAIGLITAGLAWLQHHYSAGSYETIGQATTTSGWVLRYGAQSRALGQGSWGGVECYHYLEVKRADGRVDRHLIHQRDHSPNAWRVQFCESADASVAWIEKDGEALGIVDLESGSFWGPFGDRAPSWLPLPLQERAMHPAEPPPTCVRAGSGRRLEWD